MSLRGRQVVSPLELGKELVTSLREVNAQIEAVKQFAASRQIEPQHVMNGEGNYTMVPLLAAKAQLLHALALTNQRDK